MTVENGKITKVSQLKPASFETKGKISYSVILVTNILKRALKENRQVTLDDIMNGYLDFTFNGRETIYRKALDFRCWGNDSSNKTGTVTREFLKTNHNWYLEWMSKEWFRKNLGSAIIQGKILAIPVIDIDDENETT